MSSQVETIRNQYEKLRDFFNPSLEETPPDDWRSIRYLRWDLMAALVMCPVSFVFALSISNIANMLPMTGIFAGILGCFLLWKFRGSHLGIAGPAAALAPILAGAIDALGKGNLANGQLMVLPVIFAAGILMFLVAVFKWARFTSMVSEAAIKGSILAYIGWSIDWKQIPIFLGVQFPDKSLFGIFQEASIILWEIITFQHVHVSINWLVFSIGMITLGIIIGHLFIQHFLRNSTNPFRKIFAVLPPQFFATIVAICIGYTLVIDPNFLIHLPDKLTLDPTLSWKGAELLWADKSLWGTFALYAFMLFMVDTVETCGTILGIDTMDKYRRVSNPNRALMAMAVANIAGSPFGNQSHIPGGMKSGTNAVLGAKTRNATLICGLLMAITISFGATRNVIDHIPLVALSAVIGYAGYRLWAPSVWMHFWRHGKVVFTMGGKFGIPKLFTVTDTFIVFASGFIISALTAEILAGFFSAILIEFIFTYKGVCNSAKEHAHNGVETSPMAIVRQIFRNPVVSAEMREHVFYVTLSGPLTTFNRRFVPPCPPGAHEVFVDVEHPEVTYIDSASEEQFRLTRECCCGKDNFKLIGFRPACPSGRVGSGMVREVKEVSSS